MGIAERQSYTDAKEFCDIVMKGGITSGVVYPLALAALAKKYRFSCIGGTSAGAIAAAAAAAAEYGRFSKGGGFVRLEKVPGEIGPNLLGLFQPAPKLRPLFDIFVALLKDKGSLGKLLAALLAAVEGYWKEALVGGAAGLVAAFIVAKLTSCNAFGTALFALVFAVVGLVASVVLRIVRALREDLPEHDFGLCPGLRQSGRREEGFADWITRLVNEAAGRDAGAEPLTFGDLASPPKQERPITLAMMTTSLMERRPYTLPMESDPKNPSKRNTYGFMFEKDEWKRLFPLNVMTYLLEHCERFEPTQGEQGEFYFFPEPQHLPIAVATRMSLSFPGLISAVPLWRRDFTFREAAEQQKLRRCLFSDGGLSSNFPIHFFDNLLPNRPTFAISLDEFDERRSRDGANVWMHVKSGAGIARPVESFNGLAGFLLRLLDSAKDWQDNLQSVLPGYRERIVHIGLKPEEGGLNLTMDKKMIDKLVEDGRSAGETLKSDFNMDTHRWRRFLVAGARVEETLDDVAKAYAGVAGSESFAQFLKRYPEKATEYRQGAERLEAMLSRMKSLSKLGKEWRSEPTIRGGAIPKPDTDLRITPKP